MTNRLPWLEVMRGFAACWVLLGHAHLSTNHFVGATTFDPRFVANGDLGVEFFFVLSGFIIAYSSFRLIEKGKGLRDYVSARVVRIYVPYLPIAIAMLALYAMFPSVSASERAPGVLTSLTLLPTNHPPALSVAWTLVHEVVFYALFALVFVSRTLLATVIVAWVAAIIALNLAGTPLPLGLKYVLSPINLCFVTGVLTCLLVRRDPPPWLLRGWGAVALVVLVLQAARPAPDPFLVTFAFAGLVAAATDPAVSRLDPGRFLVLLGSASYSIYLVHNPTLSIASRGVARVWAGVDPNLGYALVALVALAAGITYYWIYERPALRAVRAAMARSGDAKPPVEAPPAPLERVQKEEGL